MSAIECAACGLTRNDAEYDLCCEPPCPKCWGTDAETCAAGNCDRQEGKPLAWHCPDCGHTWPVQS